VPAGFVYRARLDDRVSAGARRGITVVTGEVGSGKTLTLASWAQSHQAARVAWLALDDGDNSLQAFWSDVLAAMKANDALPPGSPLLDVQPAVGFGTGEELLIRSAWAALPHPVVLVLDGFECVTDRKVADSLTRLLEHRPPNLRIVMASRADPPLRVHRLRLCGDFTDIRSAELAFTPTEAAELFATHGITLTRAQRDGVMARTHGWAAGLRLALMCLDPGDVDGTLARFAGSERLVAEYLVDEVIDRLPAQDCEFLITVSVAERLTGELADRLTGRCDGQLTLERLTAMNALVVGLGDGNEWFAVHPLLRDLLLHRLGRQGTAAVTRLRMLAADWFAARGDAVTAIQLAAKASRWDDVGRLLSERAAPAILTGQAPALVAALRPAAERSLAEPGTSTLLAAAVTHYHRHDNDVMRREVDDAATLIDELPPDDRPAALALIKLLEIVSARTWAPARLLRLSTGLLHQLDAIPRRRLPVRELYRVVAADNLGVGQVWAGEFARARVTLSTVEFRCTELGVGLTSLSAQGYLALLDAIEGDHRRAHQRATAARVLAGRRGWTREPQAHAIYVALAMSALERGHLEDAQAAVDEGRRMTGTGSDAACRLVLDIVAVRIAAARHDPTVARLAWSCLRATRDGIGELPQLLTRWCQVAHADAALADGDAAGAIAAIGTVRRGFPEHLERIGLAKARMLLHQPEAALEVLAPITTSLSAGTVEVVEAKILQALAAERVHRETAALAALTDAVDIAAKAGLVRPFRSAEPRLGALLQRHRHVVARHLQFTRQFRTDDPEQEQPASAMPVVEALTERELAVLRYLPTMYKAAEIAGDLFVTVNTVKSHQQSIYRKLDVRSRREAVDRARQLHLI
jgi:LuxR family maltose regulon positive regulatory protein